MSRLLSLLMILALPMSTVSGDEIGINRVVRCVIDHHTSTKVIKSDSASDISPDITPFDDIPSTLFQSNPGIAESADHQATHRAVPRCDLQTVCRESGTGPIQLDDW